MKKFKEINDLNELTVLADSELVRVKTLGKVSFRGKDYPVMAFEVGSKDLDSPVLGLFGGVHGLEKIGTHFVTTYLYRLFNQMQWDDDLRKELKTSRIVSIPMINPVGIAHNSRCNGNGVDLMRNAPIEAKNGRIPFLIGGHRISPKIPWYRGPENAPMEKEIKLVDDYLDEQIMNASCTISVDFHSGFGIRDRLWYPFGSSVDEFPNLGEVKKLEKIIDDCIPYNVYKIEPQSDVYTIHGDLWDYIYLKHQERNKNTKNLFLPWTLEMGSWTWVKKNPLQLFNYAGLYNPMKKHRYHRVMRRHKALIDLLFRATRNQGWY